MYTIEECKQYEEGIINAWDEAGKKVIENAKAEYKEFTLKEFLNHCTAMGGDWGAMLLSGLKQLYPTTWDAIPNHMGVFAFSGIMSTLRLCGVDTSSEGQTA